MLVFFKNVFFQSTIGFFGPFKTHFTLVHFWFWALFKNFVSRKVTSGAQSTHVFHVSHYIWVQMINSEEIIFIQFGVQELRPPILPFWSAHFSLVEALRSICNKSLQQVGWELSEMVWHLKIGQKLRVPGHIKSFGEFSSKNSKNLKPPGGGPFWPFWSLKYIVYDKSNSPW